MKRFVRRFYTRKCHGCIEEEYHTHHLTALGRWHYLGRIK